MEECEEKLRELAEANGVEPLMGGKVSHPFLCVPFSLDGDAWNAQAQGRVSLSISLSRTHSPSHTLSLCHTH